MSEHPDKPIAAEIILDAVSLMRLMRLIRLPPDVIATQLLCAASAIARADMDDLAWADTLAAAATVVRDESVMNSRN